MSAWPRTVEFYLHSSKDENDWLGKQIGLSKDVIRNKFVYTCYEVKLTLLVEENGDVSCVSLNGMPLQTPVSV